VDEREESALSGAARAGDEDELAALDGEVHSPQGRYVRTEVLVDILHDEDRPVGRARVGLVPRAEERERADHLAASAAEPAPILDTHGSPVTVEGEERAKKRQRAGRARGRNEGHDPAQSPP